jgi:PIN domain nuclease of toxin-antitoxin system
VIERYDLREVPATRPSRDRRPRFRPVHRDPFDRVNVAIAQAYGLALLTSDENIGNTQA